jgi:DNA-directed RNA polymerase subunit RPC12/RpoP/predicted GIY-YIG superfamily endonuclease
MQSQHKPLGYRKVTYEKSMAKRRPDLAKDFHPTRNGDMTPDTIAPGINKNLWWKCHTCNHEWQAYGHTRIREKGGACPSCAKRTVTTTHNLASVYPNIAAQWHTTKNGNKKPQHFTPGSGHRAWWQCLTCDHEWQTKIKNRNGKGCPACARKINTCSLNDYPHLLKELHPNEKKRTTFKASDKIWWQCLTCDHEWQATVGQRKLGTGCPACAGKVATPNNCLTKTHPKLAAEWHPTKNTLTASELTSGSNKRIWWECKTCFSEWKQMVNARVRGTGCPQCASGGYKQNQPGVLYVIIGEQYGKIGISNRATIHNRITHHKTKRRFTKTVALYDFADGTDALEIETRIKRSFRKKYTTPLAFDGHTEAFPANELNWVLDLIKNEIRSQGVKPKKLPLG